MQGDLRNSGCNSQLLAVERKDGRLFILDPATLKLRQYFQVMTPTSDGQFISSPAWDPVTSTLLVSSPRDLASGLGPVSFSHGLVGFRLDASCNLNKVWNTVVGQSNDGNGNYVYSPPVIVGPPGQRVAFVATGFWNSVHAIRVGDGALLWSATLDGGSSAAVFGAPSVANGTVLLGGWDYGTQGHALYAFRL